MADLTADLCFNCRAMQVTGIGLTPLLDALFEEGASDLVISAGAPPALRVDGELRRAGDRAFDADQTARLVDELLTEPLRATFREHGAVDFSFDWGALGRVRGNAFRQRGSVAMALRAIPFQIPTFAELGLPPVIEQLV